MGFDMLLAVATGLVTGVPAGLISRTLYDYRQARRVNRHLWSLLNFGPGDVFFVFPHRVGYKGILPPVAAEDFLAINNITRVLNSMGWRYSTHMRDTEQIRDNREGNLVTLGSPRTNEFARQALDELSQRHLCPFRFQEVRDKPGHWEIACEGGLLFASSTFEQEEAALAAGSSVAGAELDDVAVLAKFDNPYNAPNKLLVLAGVRGIGTWGASDYLRKNAPELHERKSASGPYSKDGNFVAYVGVKYRQYRLAKTWLLHLDDLT